MTSFTESIVEDAALTWFGKLMSEGVSLVRAGLSFLIKRLN